LPTKAKKTLFDQDKPPLEHFLDWTDSIDLEQNKIKFWNNLPQKWNYYQAIIDACSKRTEILSKSCLNFLLETFSFQVKILNDLHRKDEMILHPFSKNCFTMPSYSYKLLVYLYLNKEEIYSFSEKTKGLFRQNVSRKELEFVLFYSFKYPHLKFRHAIIMKRVKNCLVNIS